MWVGSNSNFFDYTAITYTSGLFGSGIFRSEHVRYIIFSIEPMFLNP